jgi:hypothetical protein
MARVELKSIHACAGVMVYAQLKLEPADELPTRTPAGFSELRSDMLGYADGGDLGTLQVGRLDERGPC